CAPWRVYSGLPLLTLVIIPPINLSMRVSMRRARRLKFLPAGHMCKDCLYSTFCYPCSWCQMAREMKSRNIPIVLVSAKHS
ncbi:cornifelin homolog A-like, partial [Sander lucioperca]|uniref:cornifelin homolog A-like n=1 Tax=Sander lucioperca TaxID=283035 RepID=UPI00165399A6